MKTRTLAELYVDGLNGVYIKPEDMVNAFEEANPGYKEIRLEREQNQMIKCMDVMLRNFNPKWNPGKKDNDPYYLYFDIDGKKITPQQVHDYFVKVCEENRKLKEELDK